MWFQLEFVIHWCSRFRWLSPLSIDRLVEPAARRQFSRLSSGVKDDVCVIRRKRQVGRCHRRSYADLFCLYSFTFAAARHVKGLL